MQALFLPFLQLLGGHFRPLVKSYQNCTPLHKINRSVPVRTFYDQLHIIHASKERIFVLLKIQFQNGLIFARFFPWSSERTFSEMGGAKCRIHCSLVKDCLKSVSDYAQARRRFLPIPVT